jgi:hypothetical protein
MVLFYLYFCLVQEYLLSTIYTIAIEISIPLVFASLFVCLIWFISLWTPIGTYLKSKLYFYEFVSFEQRMFQFLSFIWDELYQLARCSWLKIYIVLLWINFIWAKNVSIFKFYLKRALSIWKVFFFVAYMLSFILSFGLYVFLFFLILRFLLNSSSMYWYANVMTSQARHLFGFISTTSISRCSCLPPNLYDSI